MQEIAAPSGDSELLIQAQHFLSQREKGLPPGQELEAAWIVFYDLYSGKIRKYAFSCGATEEDIADCVQEVWTELLVRLPAFRLDPRRGQFDSWLFHIVRGKTIDLRRFHKRRLFQENTDTLQNVIDYHPIPARTLEYKETLTLAWDQLRKKLSACNLKILQLRLVEQRSVAEVAGMLGLSNEQVWYRYHRARREMEEIGLVLARGPHPLHSNNNPAFEKNEKGQESAQGNAASFVSRNGRPGSLAFQGGYCVDYVFQRLELGRRELNPEWKVEWNCDGEPRPVSQNGHRCLRRDLRHGGTSSTRIGRGLLTPPLGPEWPRGSPRLSPLQPQHYRFFKWSFTNSALRMIIGLFSPFQGHWHKRSLFLSYSVCC